MPSLARGLGSRAICPDAGLVLVPRTPHDPGQRQIPSWHPRQGCPASVDREHSPCGGCQTTLQFWGSCPDPHSVFRGPTV